MTDSNQTTKKPSLAKRTYDWFISWAEKPQADKALAGFAFAESSVFPIPPDPLLMALVFAKTKQRLRLALITTLASVLGGALGYLIGWGLFESIGQWLLDTYDLHHQYLSLGESFQNNGFIAVLTAALTPIPYKIITISAGGFKISFWIFMLASVIGRGTRFFAVGYLAAYLGAKHKEKIERYINFLSIVIVVLLIVLLLIFN